MYCSMSCLISTRTVTLKNKMANICMHKRVYSVLVTTPMQIMFLVDFHILIDAIQCLKHTPICPYVSFILSQPVMKCDHNHCIAITAVLINWSHIWSHQWYWHLVYCTDHIKCIFMTLQGESVGQLGILSYACTLFGDILIS